MTTHQNHLERVKNGIYNVFINKNLKMSAMQQRGTNWNYVNTSSNNAFYFWFFQASTITCVREGTTV